MSHFAAMKSPVPVAAAAAAATDAALKTFHFLDDRLKGTFETFIGNQVCAGERVTVSPLQSNCSIFTEHLGLFRLVKINTTKKIDHW